MRDPQRLASAVLNGRGEFESRSCSLSAPLLLHGDLAAVDLPGVPNPLRIFSHSFDAPIPVMAKPHRLIKKANHGSRPANAKARRAKRRKLRT
jgi:hypothetical protein